MFKSKVKFLALLACFSVLLLCGTLAFCLETQNFGSNVNIQYIATKELLIYELNSKRDGWIVTGYNENALNGETSLDIPDSYSRDGLTLPVVEIGEDAFNDATVFTSLTLGENIKEIGANAFEGCSNLNGELALPSNLTSIGNSAFNGCSGFSGGLTMPSNLKSIGEYAFYGCSGLTGSLDLPSNLISIGSYAFASCGFSGSITIPGNVTNIGVAPFRSTVPLTGFYVETSNSNYTSRASNGTECNIILEKSSGTLIQGCNYSTIPNDNSIFIIGDSAFYFCSKLTGTLIIPDSVISIGSDAFMFCSRLETLILPNSIKKIGAVEKAAAAAFSGCKFTYVEINCNLEMNNFMDTTLDTIKIGSEVTSIAKGAFNFSTIKNIIVDSPIIYKDIVKPGFNTGWGYTMKSGMTINILQTADDSTNSFLNDTSQFTQSTTTIDGQDYNVYTYN